MLIVMINELFSDIFQKLSSVVGQQEWLIACGAHKVCHLVFRIMRTKI